MKSMIPKRKRRDMNHNFLKFLAEKEEIEPKKSMDKTIFCDSVNGNIVMREPVLKHLVASIDKIDELIPIEGAFIIGPILRKIYSDDAPIQVIVLIDKNDINDVVHDRLLSIAANLNKTLVADTRHHTDIKITLVDGTEGAKKWQASQEALFDISKNKFIKHPIEEEDDLKLAVDALKKNEPNDLVFFVKENPIKVQFLETYTKKSLEKIKMWINTQIFNLIREANGIASTTSEKNFIKSILTDQKIDGEKLQLKFIENEVSEKIALNLLKQNYYYEILDMISSVKANQSVESDFNASLNQIFMQKESKEPEYKHPTFIEFVLTEDKKHLKKLKKIAKLVEPGKAHAKNSKNKANGHRDLGMEIRNMKRKKLRQLAAYRELTRGPIEQISDEFSCKNLIQRAKDISRGYWPINVMQAKWVAMVYHFELPTAQDRIKRLSNMPMALFKPKRGGYFLVKDDRLMGIS